MAKTSKTVPQKEAASSSRPAGGEDAAEPHLEEFVLRPYSERAWMELSKGRWEARSHGLGKDVAMRPLSGDEEVPVPKQVKEKKRKRAPRSPVSEKKKPTKKSRKPNGGSGIMPSDLIRRLRDEPKEGEEEVACVRANVVIQQPSESAEVDKGALVIIPEQGKVEAILSRAEMVEGETGGKASRAAEDISRDELGIVDITGSPQISDAMIREDNMLESRSYEGIQGSTDIHGFLDGIESVALEDIIDFDGLPVRKKESWSGVIGSSSIPKLVDRFPTLSVNPDRRRKIVLSIPEDARVFSPPVGIASYLRSLVIEEDQAMMNAVGADYLFNEAQHVLNRASVLHHEAFLRIWEEHEAEIQNLFEKSDTYKLHSEKLRADLATTRDKHTEMAEQARPWFEQIRRLQKQVDAIHAEVVECKKNMDILASKKEIVQAQLESAETELQVAKENALVQIEKIKELQHRLDLAVSDKAILTDKLEVARSEVAIARSEVAEANKRADAKVAQFRADVEVIQAKAKGMVEHVKWQARREALEGVQAQSFDIMDEIEKARVEETMVQKLAFPEEDSESSSELEDGEDSEDEDVTPDEDRAS
ncbi:interactor of constitutive active ROPs 3-like [Nicotiana tomentosiformis]|uniref:interactor of constitutive active ROPs 3-like n=1 Tax=Nicotiana tomentosiformis TaxID=4098 RepID=UPI00388CA484